MNKILETTYRLYQARDAIKSIQGEAKWNETVDFYEPYIRAEMKKSECNELRASLTIAQTLKANGHEHIEVLAVAAEMIDRGIEVRNG